MRAVPAEVHLGARAVRAEVHLGARAVRAEVHLGARAVRAEVPLGKRAPRGALRLLALATLLTIAGCGRGEARFGQSCTSDSDCQRGLCVAGVAGDAPVCTTSCGSRADCPPDWACNGVTQANVVVCSRGASTPFGEGSR